MSATNVPASTASRETARTSGRANARRQRALALRGLYLLIALAGAVIMIFPVFCIGQRHVAQLLARLHASRRDC